MGSRSARMAVAVGMLVSILGAGAVDGHAATPANASEPVPADTRAGQRCHEATGTHHAKTLVGATFYRFTHRAEFCTDGVNVVSVDNREHKMTDVDAFATFEGLVEDYVSKVPAPEVTSIMKGRVDNCVPIQGCISSKYPFVELTMRANGTWFPTTGESESS
jgi:hypothetical protein